MHYLPKAVHIAELRCASWCEEKTWFSNVTGDGVKQWEGDAKCSKRI